MRLTNGRTNSAPANVCLIKDWQLAGSNNIGFSGPWNLLPENHTISWHRNKRWVQRCDSYENSPLGPLKSSYNSLSQMSSPVIILKFDYWGSTNNWPLRLSQRSKTWKSYNKIAGISMNVRLEITYVPAFE